MDDSTLWGSVGVLLALVGVGIMAIDAEFTHALSTGGFEEPVVWYGVAVAAAAFVTFVIIVPSLVTGE